MFNRLVLILISIAGLYGCSQNTEEAKKALELTLSQVNSVEYRNVESYPGDVVCGEFDPIIRFGQHEGYRRFMVVKGLADKFPSEDDWAIYCSKQSARQLQERFGIGSPNAEGTVRTVFQHMDKLDLALQQYRADNFNFPVTAQGLPALISASELPPRPPKFRQGGYIDEIPLDPWGQNYSYSSEEKLRTEPLEYQLITLGKDGKEGGKGEDADIGTQHLRYLRHIVEL